MRHLFRHHPLGSSAFRRVLRWVVAAACHYTGAIALLNRFFPHRGALIFFGHRVAEDFDDWLGGVPPDLFERQIAWLSRHFRFLSMDELVDCLQQQRRVPDNSVVLTLDDGFADNYTQALPILEKYRVPVTVYLVTDSIDTGELPWPQRLAWVLARTRIETIQLTIPTRQRLSLCTLPERKHALKLIKDLRKQLPMSQQLALFNSVVDQCGIPTPKDRMLSWDQVQEMRQRGVTFGSHTVHHPFMKSLPLEDARWQLEQSKRVLEARLGERVRHFCFPHGSYGETVGRMAQAVGYESYFIPGGVNRTNDHLRSPFQLRRLGLSDDAWPVLPLTTTRFFTDWLRPDRKQTEKD